MPAVDRRQSKPISFDTLQVSFHPCEERLQNPPLQIPEFPAIEIVGIEDVPDLDGDDSPGTE